MKTILKVYNNYSSLRNGMEEDVRKATSGGMKYELVHSKETLEMEGNVKLVYRSLNHSYSSFRGLTVDEIYFDDLVCIDDRVRVESLVRVNQAPEENKEFYYVIEHKIGGDISQTVKTNDKALVLEVIKGGL